MELTRDLEECEVCLEKLLELADVDGGALVQAVEARARLSAQLVFDADDGGLVDARELVDELLHFARVDVLAHADDHVLEAIDDVEVAVFVRARDVARMEPAAAQRILRRFRHIPVAEHDVVAAHDELAALAFRHFVSCGVDELPLDAGDGGTDGADDGLSDRIHRDDGRGFREAVAFAYIDAEFLDEILLDLERQRRAAADDEAEALHVLRRRELREEAANGRNHIEIVDFFLADDADRLFWREAVEDDDLCAAAEREEHGARPAEAVVHRQNGEDMVFRLASHDAHLLGVRDEVLVREHGAFRRARRARRVDEGAGRVLVKIGGERGRFGKVFLRISHCLDVVLRDLEVAAQRSERIDEIQWLVRQEMLDDRVFDDVSDLAARELEVDRNGDRAERSDAEVGEDELRAVAREDGDAVALPHASRVEAVAAVPRRRRELAVGKASLVVDEGDGVGRALAHEIVYVHIYSSFLFARGSSFWWPRMLCW